MGWWDTWKTLTFFLSCWHDIFSWAAHWVPSHPLYHYCTIQLPILAHITFLYFPFSIRAFFFSKLYSVAFTGTVYLHNTIYDHLINQLLCRFCMEKVLYVINLTVAIRLRVETSYRFRIFAKTFVFRIKIWRKVAEIMVNSSESCENRWLNVLNFPHSQPIDKISIIFPIFLLRKAKTKTFRFNSS
jgi:hypothetical protein